MSGQCVKIGSRHPRTCTGTYVQTPTTPSVTCITNDPPTLAALMWHTPASASTSATSASRMPSSSPSPSSPSSSSFAAAADVPPPPPSAYLFVRDRGESRYGSASKHARTCIIRPTNPQHNTTHPPAIHPHHTHTTNPPAAAPPPGPRPAPSAALPSRGPKWRALGHRRRASSSVAPCWAGGAGRAVWFWLGWGGGGLDTLDTISKHHAVVGRRLRITIGVPAPH